MKIEAEGGELVLKNTHGDYVIIPKDQHDIVKEHIENNCNHCIDAIVSTLPTMSDYAEDGTIIPSESKDPPVVVDPPVVPAVKDTVPPIVEPEEFEFDDPEEDALLLKHRGGYDDTPYFEDTYTTPEMALLRYESDGFDAAKLQRTLSSDGYRLPSSTKKDGSFDGVYGAETEGAFKAYNIRNPSRQIHPNDRDPMGAEKIAHTDKELANIKEGDEGFSPLRVQNALANRGYDLPKSKTADGFYDGIFGDETSKALSDYQSKNDGLVTVEETPQWETDRASFKPRQTGFWETLNYKNWGISNYSDYSSFNSAYRNARTDGEQEFVFKNKRYTTEDITSSQNENFKDSKAFLNDYYRNNDFVGPILHDDQASSEYDHYMRSKQGTDYQTYSDKLNSPVGPRPTKEQLKKLESLKIGDWRNDHEFLEFSNKRMRSASVDRLNAASYFSITNQNGEEGEDHTHGFFDSENRQVFIDAGVGEEGSFQSTSVHELNHKADEYAELRVPETKMKESPFDKRFTDYLSDPTEIESRKMSFLYYAKKNNVNLKGVGLSGFEDILSVEYDNMPYDVQQLIQLYGNNKQDLLKYLQNDFSYLKK